MSEVERAQEVLADIHGYRPNSAQRTAFLAGNLIPIIFPDDAIRAMLVFAALESPIPAGWKLVPVEPTDAMVKACTTVRAVHAYNITDAQAYAAWASAEWSAMLAAAPSPGDDA